MMGIENLYKRKAHRLFRASSFDRTGRNDDCLFVAAGERIEFADLQGPGIIRHIVMIPDNIGDSLDGMVLRIYWEENSTPSVEVPLGHFFGMGFGKKTQLISLPIVVSPGGCMNCYFPMPFQKRARFEIENQGSKRCKFYFHIDYEYGCVLDDEICFFHASWNGEHCKGTRGPDATEDNYDAHNNYHDIIANTGGKDNYKILHTHGRGHYCGCFMHVFSLLPSKDNWRCWWGEGDDMIFVDGEQWPPSIHGTGTEEYFGDAWGLHLFCAPFSGCHYIDALSGAAGRHSAYRFHVLDPIPFNKEILVSIEHGHGNERSDIIQSVAFYYLDAIQECSALPSIEDRILFNDFEIVPRKIAAPQRTGPYDRKFPDSKKKG